MNRHGRWFSFLLLNLCLLSLTGRGAAETALSLTQRMEIDGYSNDFTVGEEIFGLNEELDRPEESTTDSEWGAFNDLNQIKITWDALNIYIAVDGIIENNNMILFLDVTNRNPDTAADDGLVSMVELNSWRRNFVFSEDFSPDLFFATWDRNTQPQIWVYKSVDEVTDAGSGNFRTMATFDQSASGRSMEAAIPWSLFFLGESQLEFNGELGTSVYPIPTGMDTLRLAAVITAGPDGTGGPDSAPDNFGGHTIDSSTQVLIDNFVILPLDTDEVAGTVDFGIEPRNRVSFKQRPPIQGIVFELNELTLDRAIASPEEGLPLEFHVEVKPGVPAGEEWFRVVSLTARIYDSLGEHVSTLYELDGRFAAEPRNPVKDRWDGRDKHGRMVGGGIYILSVVSEPGLSRATKAFSVVR